MNDPKFVIKYMKNFILIKMLLKLIIKGLIIFNCKI